MHARTGLQHEHRLAEGLQLAVADAIERILDDPALASDLVERGRTRERDFTWERSVDTVAAELRRIGDPAYALPRAVRRVSELELRFAEVVADGHELREALRAAHEGAAAAHAAALNVHQLAAGVAAELEQQRQERAARPDGLARRGARRLRRAVRRG